ncbi:30S ribosomal protein S2 [Candidatus Parcubacteria bacterium]|nr:30S ribosomal protein S2 [Candidatus Parcubacteria bacterium]
MDETTINNGENSSRLDQLFSVGAHFGYQRTRRHPSVKSFIFGSKNRVDIIDLEKTEALLDKAKEFARGLGREKKQLLFVGTKPEARGVVRSVAERLNMPYVIERWVGGTFTNFPEIRKRLERYQDFAKKKEEGALEVYTKKERLLIDREMEELNKNFGGLMSVKGLPAAMFVVDSRNEEIAVLEAVKMRVPVISLSNSDCDVSKIAYPVVGNDSALASIAFFVEEIGKAYEEGANEVLTA